MNTEHLITVTALSSMAVGAFLSTIDTTLTTMIGGLAFGLGFATISTQLIARLEAFK